MPIKLGDILKNRSSNQPPEIDAIKKFVAHKFNSEVNVVVKPSQITIIANNSALAGSLRMHLPQLQKALKTDKKLVIRTG